MPVGQSTIDVLHIPSLGHGRVARCMLGRKRRERQFVPKLTLQSTSSIPRDINSNLWQNSTPPGQPPIARFTMQSGSVQKRENDVLNLTVPPGSTAPVDFSAVLSFDPDGTIPTYKDAYRWYVNGNLQDGEPNEPCAGRSFSKNFPAGTWQILLIVQDNQGAIGAVGASIVVTDGSVPTASTVAATNVTANSATLNGTVNPNG